MKVWQVFNVQRTFTNYKHFRDISVIFNFQSKSNEMVIKCKFNLDYFPKQETQKQPDVSSLIFHV